MGFLRAAGAEVKVEVSPVLRGAVTPLRINLVTDAVEEVYDFAEMLVLALEYL